MLKKKSIVLVIVLMCIIGTCMHFVCDVVSAEGLRNVLMNVFPANETSWEHMKMIWFPFLVAGIILSLKKKQAGFFGAFVIMGFVAMPIQLGLFATYQSFAGTSILILDIIFYMADMILCAIAAFSLAQKEWVRKTFILWFIVAIAITAGIVYLTYYPGGGYVFWDDTKLT